MAGFARFGAVLGGSAVWVAGAVTLSQQLTKSNCKANEQGDHHNVLIIGGGTSGLAVAGQLMRHSNRPAGTQVSVVDPSHLHAYQPMWTMVGGSLGFKKENSCKPMADVIPKGVNHLSEGVKDFVPDKNQVVLQNGKTITYDYLVMATGIKPDWEKIEGLKEALDDPKCPVASIYDFHHSEKVDRIMSEFKGGVAIFTQPACPIKCGGAPQKVMWLQEEMFRKRGIRGDVDLNFCTNLGAMFAVKKYADSLAKLVVDKNVNVHHKNNLVKVDKDAKIATFQHLDTQELIQRPFDVLHVAPYMSPPEVVQKSSLANENGFVDVDKHTLQHTKHPNVFGIGDSSNLPTSKTAAAISSQAPVLVSNLLHKMKDEPVTAKYDGYTSCPIFVGDKKLVLALPLSAFQRLQSLALTHAPSSAVARLSHSVVFSHRMSEPRADALERSQCRSWPSLATTVWSWRPSRGTRACLPASRSTSRKTSFPSCTGTPLSKALGLDAPLGGHRRPLTKLLAI